MRPVKLPYGGVLLHCTLVLFYLCGYLICSCLICSLLIVLGFLLLSLPGCFSFILLLVSSSCLFSWLLLLPLASLIFPLLLAACWGWISPFVLFPFLPIVIEPSNVLPSLSVPLKRSVSRPAFYMFLVTMDDPSPSKFC